MKAPAFEYLRPSSLSEALAGLSSDEDAKLLAGGQSLIPLLNMRLSRPTLLVDLGAVAGLDEITCLPGAIRIGAMVRQRDAELSPLIAAHCPLLAGALRLVAHPQIRNQGTIGGSLAHADPAAELPAAVLALDGLMHVAGSGGQRTISADDFFVSHLTTALQDDEILTAVELPARSPGEGWACEEVTLRPGDFPLCGAAALVSLDANGVLAGVGLALYGVADRPVRARDAELLLHGQEPTPERLAAAADTATRELSPTADIHASAEYRRRLAATITRRTLTTAIARAKADDD